MILSAAHRPLNPPFRRAPVSNVRRDKVGKGIRRGVFGTFCGQKVQSTPRAKTAVNSRPKAANNTSRRLRSVLFAAKKYITFRGRRPRLTADQKAANNISRRLRSVLFATQQHLEIPATGGGARASVSAKSVAIFRPGTRFATFGLVVPGKIVTFGSYLFKPIERCSNACSRLRPSSIKRG